MIVRVARFEAGRGDLGLDRSEWVIEALRGEMPKWLPYVNELLQLIGGGGFMATPSRADMDGPLADEIAKYYQAAGADAADEAMAKIEEARERLGIEVSPADDAVMYEVVGSLERP